MNSFSFQTIIQHTLSENICIRFLDLARNALLFQFVRKSSSLPLVLHSLAFFMTIWQQKMYPLLSLGVLAIHIDQSI